MHTHKLLSLNFLLFTICGLWRPLDWSSKRSKLLYSIATFLTMYLFTYLLLNHFLSLILVVDNVDDFALTTFILLSIIAVYFKGLTVIRYRDNIINVLKILQEAPCKARDEEENDIQNKFNHFIRSCTVNYLVLANGSLTSSLIKAIFEAIFKGILPYNLWVPWDCSSSLIFWLTSLQEIIAFTVGLYINIASDTVVPGFCLQICAQFEILKHRLQKMVKPREKEDIFKDSYNVKSIKTGRLSEHIAHHLCIIRLAKMINDIYSQVIFIQFFASLLILCLSIYYLSSHTTMTEVASWTIFVICMFVQIFIYCWAGNEVTLQSIGMSEAVYNMDWTSMTISERKDLLMIMKHSRAMPVKFNSSFLIIWSLDSYTKLLKMSYSAFNLLQQS